MSSTSKNVSYAHPLVATTAYYLSFIILGLTTAASGPSLLKLAEHTASALDVISLIFVFSSLGYLIGSFLGGRAHDRFSSHKLMSITLVLMAVTCVFIPISGSLNVLLLAMFINGFAAGILDVGCNALLLWTHGENAGPYLNGLHFFFGVGSLLAPLAFAQILLETGDIQWLYWSFAIVTLPMALWLWFLQEPKHGMTEEVKSAPFPILPVLIMAVLFFLYVGLELGFANWIYTYALTLNLETEVTAAGLTAAFWGSFTFGRLLGIWISTRLHSKTILFMDIIGCAISTAIIILWNDSSTALWIGTIGLGISMASIFPTLMMLAGERMQITGTITGWFLVGSGAGSMLLPWLIGQIFVVTGPQAMTTILLITLVGFVLALLLFINIKIKPLPELSPSVD
ncbi:MAG TPA: MFS transporter [Anaerolineales bacterium]|nr:MFS transporter [Anaerolineales bacterium]